MQKMKDSASNDEKFIKFMFANTMGHIILNLLH
jgi:hypothetical protein